MTRCRCFHGDCKGSLAENERCVPSADGPSEARHRLSIAFAQVDAAQLDANIFLVLLSKRVEKEALKFSSPSLEPPN